MYKGKVKYTEKIFANIRRAVCIDKKYFNKELDDIDKLEIQKEKLKRQLKE